jgi:hypothetical protein
MIFRPGLKLVAARNLAHLERRPIAIVQLDQPRDQPASRPGIRQRRGGNQTPQGQRLIRGDQNRLDTSQLVIPAKIITWTWFLAPRVVRK